MLLIGRFVGPTTSTPPARSICTSRLVACGGKHQQDVAFNDTMRALRYFPYSGT